jgi:pyruvate,water dikinase
LEWALEPSPIIEGIKARTLAILSGIEKRAKPANGGSIENGDLNPLSKLIVSQMLPKARKAVARREQTKGWSIGVQHQFKLAYRHLAELMVKEAMLDDADQIFFLQHAEIGDMLRSGQFDFWKKIASDRRNNYKHLQQLSFPDVSFGIPVPFEENKVQHDGELSGVPVSQGIAIGPVHIVQTMDEAKKLKKGEIMVARFTDIGWTPFYGIISGLITEIGSPLSHGAVVAREYGLPAVVSMKGALQKLRTGQLIKLDATKGMVEIIQEAETD